MKSWFYLIACFLLVSCERSNLGYNPDWTKDSSKGGISKELHLKQILPIRSAFRSNDLKVMRPSFGMQIRSPRLTEVVSSSSTHVLIGENFRLSLTQVEQQNIDPHVHPGASAKSFIFINVEGGYSAWVQAPPKLYRFYCLGNVTLEFCQTMASSLQIIEP
jgi:hypothetical protein